MIEVKKLALAPGLNLPLDIAGQTTAIFGIRGAGKTNTAGALVEELLDHSQPVAIIDPTDAWWGLRAGRDSEQSGGYPIFIFGGSHGDVPLQETDGKIVAEFLVREQVSVILSLRHLRKGAQRRFVREFCEELYHLKGKDENRTPLTVVIDEAPLFVPQKVMGDAAFVVGAVEDLIARGRNSGFGVVLISQRSATLNADVRTQADTMICHRLPAALDRKAIRDWFEENASVEDLGKILTSLATLKNGEGWVWSPALGIMSRVQMRMRRTFDSSATPKVGQVIRAPKKLADIDLGKLREKMTAAVEQAKADDPKELRKRIAELERAHGECQPVVDTTAIEAAAEARGFKQGTRTCADMLVEPIRQLNKAFSDFITIAGSAEDGLVPNRSSDARPVATQPTETKAPRGGPKKAPCETAEPVSETDGAKLPEGERVVLTAIAQHRNGVDRLQVSILTGYKRSSRDTYMQRLRGRDLINVAGDRIHATQAGIAALGNFTPLPTGRKLQEYWLSRLPEGERRILDIAIRAYPKSVSREDVSSATEYKRSSRDTYIQRLSARKLVTTSPLGVTASRELFS